MNISQEKETAKNIHTSSSLELAEFIKTTHKSLRTIFKQNKDEVPESLWNKYIQDKAHLQKYAEAMYALATEHWDNKTNVSRIQWIHDAIQDYFFKGGLEQRTAKEHRKVHFIKESELTTFETLRDSLEPYGKSQPLRVLDVGSCYNPFSRFHDLDVTAIDLHPATPNVSSCDFLTVKIVKTNDGPGTSKEVSTDGVGMKRHSPTTSGMLQQHKKTKLLGGHQHTGLDITELEAAFYDAVIFCLFLEYLPSPQMRFACCQKAYDLLKPNGLLCIVTPDSKHDGANVHLFKIWKITLSNLGFDRIRYHKSPHFHAMIFRKGLIPDLWRDDCSKELTVMKSKTPSRRFTGISYESILESIPIVQEIEDLRSRASPTQGCTD